MALHATAVRRRPAAGRARVLDTVTLDHQARHRRRIRLTTDAGRALLLDLAETTRLADGDLLEVMDGGTAGVVAVRAAAEPLLEVTAADATGLARLAWHLGNRHTACEVGARPDGSSALWILPDPVLAGMLRGLGATVEAVTRPFTPEGGAYAPGDPGRHDHGAPPGWHLAHD